MLIDDYGSAMAYEPCYRCYGTGKTNYWMGHEAPRMDGHCPRCDGVGRIAVEGSTVKGTMVEGGTAATERRD